MEMLFSAKWFVNQTLHAFTTLYFLLKKQGTEVPLVYIKIDR
jgi:hypothetical protein